MLPVRIGPNFAAVVFPSILLIKESFVLLISSTLFTTQVPRLCRIMQYNILLSSPEQLTLLGTDLSFLFHETFLV